MAFQIPPEINATQDNWRFCDYCFVLYWNGPDVHSTAGQGACPGRPLLGGNAQHHQGPSWDFHLFANTHNPGVPVGVPGAVKTLQPDWRFCGNCFSLWFNGYANKGVCNAFDRAFDNAGKVISSTPHSAISWNFFLMGDPDLGL